VVAQAVMMSGRSALVLALMAALRPSRRPALQTFPEEVARVGSAFAAAVSVHAAGIDFLELRAGLFQDVFIGL
jgi:hypothetical protein